jgi:hypothetical protein
MLDDRALGNAESLGDVMVGQSIANVPEHLHLAWREPRRRIGEPAKGSVEVGA